MSELAIRCCPRPEPRFLRSDCGIGIQSMGGKIRVYSIKLPSQSLLPPAQPLPIQIPCVAQQMRLAGAVTAYDVFNYVRVMDGGNDFPDISVTCRHKVKLA